MTAETVQIAILALCNVFLAAAVWYVFRTMYELLPWAVLIVSFG